MKKVTIDTSSKAYEVFIEAGVRHSIGKQLETVLTQAASSVFIITDSQVAPLYLDDVVASFEETFTCLYSRD